MRVSRILTKNCKAIKGRETARLGDLPAFSCDALSISLVLPAQ